MSSKTVVITPYYEDLASKKFCQVLAEEYGSEYSFIIVDDGSVGAPIQESDLSKHGLNGFIIRLKRNVGHQNAIAVGLAYAVENIDFEQVVIMDSDGEDQPKDIQILINVLKENDIDVVVAKRNSRIESLTFKAFYFLYQLLFRVLVGRTITFGNFMAMSKLAASRIAQSPESRIHIAASVLNSKLRMKPIPVDRGARYAGQSKMNLVSLTLHGIRSIMVFAESVLVRITLFCAAFAGLIFLAMAVMVIAKIAGFTILGWYSTISGILLLLLFQVAIMALLVLLLAGNMRSKPIETMDHNEFIEQVITIN